MINVPYGTSRASWDIVVPIIIDVFVEMTVTIIYV